MNRYPNNVNVMTPPLSKQGSLQSRSSNGNAMYGLSSAYTNSAMSPSQAQLALYHDGFQVGSPQPMPKSPYPMPTPRNTQIEDPKYQEFLEWKRRQELAEEEEQQKQQQQQAWQQRQQEQQWAQQQQWQQQQQQRFPPSPPQPFPLPPNLQRGTSSSYASMDDADQQYQQQFAAPQPYIHSVRPGHKYGKITARGQAKIMLGNGVSGKQSGFERQHEYGEVDIQDNVQIKAGDFGAPEITSFFRPPN